MAMREFGFSETDCFLVARRAYELALQGAYDQAEVLLTGLVAVDPADRYSVLTLAAVHLKQKRAGDAISLLRTWLTRDAADSEARALLLEAYIDAGRRADAEQEWQRLHTSGTPVPRRLELRWRAFLQAGDGSLVVR